MNLIELTGDQVPRLKLGYIRVLIEDWRDRRYVVYLPAETVSLYRGRADIVAAISQVRTVYPELPMKKVGLL